MIFSDDTKILSYNKLFDVLNFDAICDMVDPLVYSVKNLHIEKARILVI